MKVRSQLGPFLYNKREEGWKEADRILEGLKLQTSFEWAPYDPNHFYFPQEDKIQIGYLFTYEAA